MGAELLFDLVDLVVRVEFAQTLLDAGQDLVLARAAGDPPAPPLGNPLKESPECCLILASVVGHADSAEHSVDVYGHLTYRL